MPITFRLHNNSTQTISEQICQQLELGIIQGLLQPGEGIQSVRQLAFQLKVNPNTVAKALNLLVQNGSLVSKKGKGFFVNEKTNQFSEEEKQKRLKLAAEEFVAKTRPLGFERNNVLLQAILDLLPVESEHE